ncbi:TIGR02391 family protein [Christiangramia sp. SM2212]|uniref:TIGR02391 family protein n=1 Tax=Christiangramia sediminicola TaxID=3073267 RepID=A0ABU1ERW1_9FLAO|nr:TIGR02391 family protein [Christiangramia sp. SM2212]MDR5591131.1 TIGR02391 family protein [Christiangramia sp. SM2212]
MKYDTSVNEINRVGQSILKINKEKFENDSITSIRAKEIYNWIMSLGKTSLTNEDRTKRLVKFCMELSPEADKGGISEFLINNGCDYNAVNRDSLNNFNSRNYHPEIKKHSQKLFLQQNYFHSVFESAKAFNNSVKAKSKSEKDGQDLMMNVFSLNGVLKLNTGRTDTEKSVQDGVKFLTSGLMRAVRNPTAHEPALDWPINKQECLDFLSMISFLFHQLDKSVYYSA